MFMNRNSYMRRKLSQDEMERVRLRLVFSFTVLWIAAVMGFMMARPAQPGMAQTGVYLSD